MSKNLKISKIKFIHFFKPKFDGESDANLEKMIGAREMVFRALFSSCSQHFDPQNTYFDVFLTFLPYYDHHPQILGGEGVHTNSKKSKSPDMILNTPKLS